MPDSALASGFIGKYLGYMGTNISPALLGVGYIVGLNIGIVVVSGSMLSFNIAIPLYHAYFLPTTPSSPRPSPARARDSAAPSARKSRRRSCAARRSAISASARCSSAASGR